MRAVRIRGFNRSRISGGIGGPSATGCRRLDSFERIASVSCKRWCPVSRRTFWLKGDIHLNGITQFLIGLEGTVAETRILGKRRLAYPIKHQGEGYYVLVHFKARPAAGPQLEARLNILEEVLRYLLVNQD